MKHEEDTEEAINEAELEKELTELECNILSYIDKKTWSEDTPIYRTKKDKTGRKKARYVKIKRSILQLPKRGKTPYNIEEIEFNKALNMLKKKMLVTSRTKCQKFAGLVTTQKGHNLLKK